jgi:hypothetical protein
LAEKRAEGAVGSYLMCSRGEEEEEELEAALVFRQMERMSR